jgi:hypothetical protein
MEAETHQPRPTDEAAERAASGPRSRRSVLAAAVAAAGGALATQALVRPTTVAAADVVLGAINSAPAATTIRSTQALNSAKAIVGVVTFAGPGSSTAGVQGQSNSQNGNGVFGVASIGNSKGVWGRSVNGRGVYGEATAAAGQTYGVYGQSASDGGIGVHGSGTYGVSGFGRYGVYATGVIHGVRGGSTNGTGVHGESTNLYGVRGKSTNSYGVFGDSNTGHGVGGRAYSLSGYGVVGANVPGTGVAGFSDGSHGVYGFSTNSHGVFGRSQTGVAVYGEAPQAGYFLGNVFVEGTLGKSGGSFIIDHPADPANRTLEHSFVEAPERLNVYRGSVTLNSRGSATVRLPRYYQLLNTDHSVQLTAVGSPAPSLHVSRRVEGGRFAIAGGAPGQEVYWQVTGARQDKWARMHPLRVERTKKRKDRGKYLNPDLFGHPRSAAIFAAPRPPRRPRFPKPADAPSRVRDPRATP